MENIGITSLKYLIGAVLMLFAFYAYAADSGKISSEEIAQECASFENNYNNVDSATQISEAIDKLTMFKKNTSDEALKATINQIGEKYYGLLKMLKFHYSTPKDGKCTFWQTLRGRPFKASYEPVLHSDCIKDMKAKALPDGYTYEVTYNDSDCNPADDIFIQVEIHFPHGHYGHYIYLN